MPKKLPDYTQWLKDNPLYRMECYLAWRVGEATLRAFLEGDEATRRFITSNLLFLRDLFGLPEFNPGSEE